MQLDGYGNVTQQAIDQQALLPLAQSKPGEVQAMTDFHRLIQQGLESLSVSFPGRGQVKPLESWKSERRVAVDTPGPVETGRLDVTFTYQGVRSRNGREEAVITMNGMVKGKEEGIRGTATGDIVVDVVTGQTTAAKSTVVLQLDAVLSEPGEGDRSIRVI